MEINYLMHWDEVSLENLEVRCLVGIYPRERVEPQPINVQIKLYLDTRRAARTCSLSYSVDYSSIASEVSFILQKAKFNLIETAVDAIAHHLLNSASFEENHELIQAVQVSIEKPKALPGKTMPRISIFRRRGELGGKQSGRLHLVHSCKDSMIVKVCLQPGSSLSFSKGLGLDMADAPLGAGMKLNGHSWLPNFSVMRLSNSPSVVVNTSEKPKVLLTVARRVLEFVDISDEINRSFVFSRPNLQEFLS